MHPVRRIPEPAARSRPKGRPPRASGNPETSPKNVDLLFSSQTSHGFSVCLDEPGKRICSSGGLSRAAEAGFLCIAWWSCLRWRCSLHNSGAVVYTTAVPAAALVNTCTSGVRTYAQRRSNAEACLLSCQPPSRQDGASPN